MIFSAGSRRLRIVPRHVPPKRERKTPPNAPEFATPSSNHPSAVDPLARDHRSVARAETQSRRAQALATFCSVDPELPFYERFNAMTALYGLAPNAEAVTPLRTAYWNPRFPMHTSLRRMVLHYFFLSAADVAIGALAEIFVDRDGHLPYIGLPMLTGPLIVYAHARQNDRFEPRLASLSARRPVSDDAFVAYSDDDAPPARFEPPAWNASAAAYGYFERMISRDRGEFQHKLFRIAHRQHHPPRMKIAAQTTLHALFDDDPALTGRTSLKRMKKKRPAQLSAV